MNSIDLLIIYFSIGAPLGVYSYFQNRSDSYQNNSLLKNIFPFLFWFPTAFRLIKNRTFFRNAEYVSGLKETSALSGSETKLFLVRKRLEKFTENNHCRFSIYEFRETLERYAGLTLACKNQNPATSETAGEFFRTAKNKNVEIAAKCFDRRNRQRLFFHQTSARHDFLQLASDLFAAVSDGREFVRLTLEFADLLEDGEARNEIEKMIVENSFTEKTLETDIWKPRTLKQLNANSSTSSLLQMATATPRLPKKD